MKCQRPHRNEEYNRIDKSVILLSLFFNNCRKIYIIKACQSFRPCRPDTCCEKNKSSFSNWLGKHLPPNEMCESFSLYWLESKELYCFTFSMKINPQINPITTVSLNVFFLGSIQCLSLGKFHVLSVQRNCVILVILPVGRKVHCNWIAILRGKFF